MNILKGSIIFVVGAAIGVGGTYKYFEKKFGDIADAEIESIKMMARKNMKNAEVVAVTHGEDIDGDMIDGKYVNILDEQKKAKAMASLGGDFDENVINVKVMKDDHKTYNDISAAYKTKEADNKIRENKQRTNYNEISDNKIIEMAKGACLDKVEPIVISAQSFVEECLDYDKLTLNYYEGNGVLLDDHNDVFVDFEDYIGHDTLDQFGAFGVGDNLVYVRNDKWESDYEIIKFDESYEE